MFGGSIEGKGDGARWGVVMFVVLRVATTNCTKKIIPVRLPTNGEVDYPEPLPLRFGSGRLVRRSTLPEAVARIIIGMPK